MTSIKHLMGGTMLTAIMASGRATGLPMGPAMAREEARIIFPQPNSTTIRSNAGARHFSWPPWKTGCPERP